MKGIGLLVLICYFCKFWFSLYYLSLTTMPVCNCNFCSTFYYFWPFLCKDCNSECLKEHYLYYFYLSTIAVSRPSKISNSVLFLFATLWKRWKYKCVKFYYALDNELKTLPGWFAIELLTWKTSASMYIHIFLNEITKYLLVNDCLQCF